MGGITIRRATEADIEALLERYREFHEFHVRGVPDRLRIPERYDDDEARARLREVLRDPDAALFVAQSADLLVGLAEVYLKRDEPHPATMAYTYGYLQSLMVTESLRRQSVGQRLVEATHRWAKEHGAAEMRLNTWEFVGGPQAFYEGVGYRTLQRTLVLTLAAEE